MNSSLPPDCSRAARLPDEIVASAFNEPSEGFSAGRPCSAVVAHPVAYPVAYPVPPFLGHVARDASRCRFYQSPVHEAANRRGHKLWIDAGEIDWRKPPLLPLKDGFENLFFDRRELVIAHRRRSLRIRKGRARQIPRMGGKAAVRDLEDRDGSLPDLEQKPRWPPVTRAGTQPIDISDH